MRLSLFPWTYGLDDTAQARETVRNVLEQSPPPSNDDCQVVDIVRLRVRSLFSLMISLMIETRSSASSNFVAFFYLSSRRWSSCSGHLERS